MRTLPTKYAIGNTHKSSMPKEAMANIARLIGDLKLKPGDKIPSEAELCSILDVSRVVVREAISGLNAVGLVESRQGYGNVVADCAQTLLKPSSLFIDANAETLLEVVQVRRMFEIEIARMAAMNRTESDLELIELHIIKLGSCDKFDVDSIVENDINFHLALTKCTKNKFLFRVMVGVSSILIESRKESFRDSGALKRAVDEHRDILDAIRLSDADLAVAAMDRHLTIVEQRVRGRPSQA